MLRDNYKGWIGSFQPTTTNIKNTNIKAIIVPHAGLSYSGIIADKTYSQINWNQYDKIIMLSTHHKPGNFLPESIQFNNHTLNNFNIDLVKSDEAFKNEHSWLVQMPFLPTDKPIYLILIGTYNQNLTNQLKTLIDNKTLLICNTDLSHCGSNFDIKCDNPKTKDEETIKKIINKENDFLPNEMCGSAAVRTFIEIWKTQNWKYKEHYYGTNYGDSLIDNHIGYLSMVFTQQHGGSKNTKTHINLLQIPRKFMEFEKTDFELKELGKEELAAFITTEFNSRLTRFKAMYTWEDPNKSYGIFVTIEKNGVLRGCLGTFTPVTVGENIAKYTFYSAYLDSRFNPLESSELPFLSYKVNFLGKSIVTNLTQLLESDTMKFGKNGHGITITFTDNSSATYLSSVLQDPFQIYDLNSLNNNFDKLVISLYEKATNKLYTENDIRNEIQKIEIYMCKEFKESDNFTNNQLGGNKYLKLKIKKLI
jgi:MEMO1 family protein